MLIKHDDTERVFDKHIHAPKIKKIYNASRHELLPEELGRLIPAWTVALNSKLTFELAWWFPFFSSSRQFSEKL